LIFFQKVEEEKKLADLEDKLIKVDTELVELKDRYKSERIEIDELKTKINTMETSMKQREAELNTIKAELSKFNQEQASIEIKLDTRRGCLNELNMNLKAAITEVDKNSSKVGLLKTLQTNLKQLLKRYEDHPVESETELNDEIKKLEEENVELNKQIKKAIEATNNKIVFEDSMSVDEFKSPVDDFAVFPSDTGFTEDPFKVFDPFKDSGSGIGDVDPFKDGSNDPFKDTSIDPFKVC